MLETLLVIAIVFACAAGVVWRSGKKIRQATHLCDGASEGKNASQHNCDDCMTPCPLKEIKQAAQRQSPPHQ